jgi:hypothetical protein
MARGRHARPGLLSWLWPGRSARRRADAAAARSAAQQLQAEVERVRALSARSAGAAARAEARADRVEREAALLVAQLTELRQEVGRLREELLWSFAERRLPGPTVDGRSDGPTGSTGGVRHLGAVGRTG